ncbi:MAG: hypothetical protein JW795_02535, partial [Chitinivibrionales bacterium]|nr:hypothetical protein [Chitinivibrionales bacterium]
MKKTTMIMTATIVVMLMASIQGQTFQKNALLLSGNSGKKIDIVIVGDGFADGGDQTVFNNEVNSLIMQGVFTEGPFWEDMNAFNIYSLNLISQESGVTQVDASGKIVQKRNTILDFRYSGLWAR